MELVVKHCFALIAISTIYSIKTTTNIQCYIVIATAHTHTHNILSELPPTMFYSSIQFWCCLFGSIVTLTRTHTHTHICSFITGNMLFYAPLLYCFHLPMYCQLNFPIKCQLFCSCFNCNFVNRIEWTHLLHGELIKLEIISTFENQF